jgi:hypothetical protein
MGYHCTVCGNLHEEPDLPDLGMEFPDPYLDVPEQERDERTEHSSETCIVRDEDGEHYFIRGVILVPVHGQEEPFGIGVWVSQSRQNFARYLANEAMAPTFGWLCNRIDFYSPTTYLLKTRVHFQEGGRRANIELEPTEHPLAVDQREGISLPRAWEIVHRYLPN